MGFMPKTLQKLNRPQQHLQPNNHRNLSCASWLASCRQPRRSWLSHSSISLRNPQANTNSTCASTHRGRPPGVLLSASCPPLRKSWQGYAPSRHHLCTLGLPTTNKHITQPAEQTYAPAATQDTAVLELQQNLGLQSIAASNSEERITTHRGRQPGAPWLASSRQQ